MISSRDVYQIFILETFNSVSFTRCTIHKAKELSLTVAIVIPLFFSSGALSISSKAMALALPSSASTCSTKSIRLYNYFQHKTWITQTSCHKEIEKVELTIKTRKSTQTFVIAAVSVVFPWSTCPMVPTLRWGFLQKRTIIIKETLMSQLHSKILFFQSRTNNKL